MHHLIGHIVYAENEKEARSNAINNAENICESGRVFDWFNDTDGRWDECLKPIPVNSPKGKELIDSLWEDLLRDRKDAYDKVVAYVNGDKGFPGLFEKRPGMDRYYFHVVGDYYRSTLYDNDGEAIIDAEHLKDSLARWKDKDGKIPEQYKKLRVFIVPIDMHS